MDRDGSGAISRDELDCEEFRTILRKVLTPTVGRNMGGMQYSRAQMNMDQAVQYFLRKADCNQDNSISFEEFKAFMRTMRTGAYDSANSIFALFDLDSNGIIDEGEFREIYRFFLGHAPRDWEFQEEWGKLDVHGDGKVTKDQYMTWMRETQNPLFSGHAPVDQQQLEEEEDGAWAMGGSTNGFQFQKDADGWKPWHSYSHFAWSEPGKGKPSHVKMKFRATEKCKTSLQKQQLAQSRSAKSAMATEKTQQTSTHSRPPWNQRLTEACPNWSTMEGKPRRVVGQRKLFSRPQSLPELKRHLETKPGKREHCQNVLAPELPRQRCLLSHEGDGSDAQVLSLPSRDKPAGFMRHPGHRQRTKWNQHFLTPFQLRDHYDPPPCTAVGFPPRHLYADLYEDEP